MYKYDSTGWFDALIKFSDGRVGTIESQNSATSAEGTGSATSNLIAMDNKTKTAAVVCKLTSSAYGLFSGNSTYAAGYNNGAYLFAIDSTTGQGNVVLNWLSCNIDSDYISGVAFLDDGRVACLSNEYNQKTQTNTPELALLTKTKAADASQKKVLTLATQYLDPTLKSQVLDFNKTNPDYRIEVTDYSQYNTDADYSAGLKKMTTEILTGSVPDIIFTQGVNMDQLITKGIVTDLNQFMESDKEVGLDTISDNVLKALEVDGKLYEADSSYTLFTVMGNPAIVGTTPGWTVDDLNAAFKKMPEGSTIFDNTVAQADILNLCLAMDMSDYVNWATGECSFDKGGFQKLLEFAKSFPSKIDWDNYDWESYQDPAIRVAAGKQMLLQSYISAFSDYMMYKTEFGGKMTCIGFPTANGVGNMLYMNSGYAISAKCADKAGAWQFVRTFLTKDFQESNMNGFPTNKAAFSDALKQAMTPQYQKDENGKYVLDKNGNKIEQPLGSIQNANNETVNYYALKQSDADEIMQIINSTDKIIKYDENIVNIMKDDCDAYFSGEKSAEETAKLIQSRVSIYVNEQS
jgi:ABC-type glycerol-3-phosphate transport system substrate-binding protein